MMLDAAGGGLTLEHNPASSSDPTAEQQVDEVPLPDYFQFVTRLLLAAPTATELRERDGSVIWTAQIHQIYPSWPPKRFRSSYPADDTWTETNDGNVVGHQPAVPQLIPVVSSGPGVT